MTMTTICGNCADGPDMHDGCSVCGRVSNRRDLIADLAICDAATDGPWEARHWTVEESDRYFVLQARTKGKEVATAWQGVRYPSIPEISDSEARSNSVFIAAARTGWPDAIRRALSAEASEVLMARTIAMMTDRLTAAERQVSRAEESLQSVLRCLSWEAEDWEAYKRYRALEPSMCARCGFSEAGGDSDWCAGCRPKTR